MDSRQAAVLLVVLLLVTDWGHAEGPESRDGDQIFAAMQRPDRSPAFLFQPQRFGRNARGSWSSERLIPRAGGAPSSLFWSLAAPQRFGKK